MGFFISAALSYTILVPVTIGILRFSKINSAYYPFIFCLCMGLINETLSVALVMNGYYNTVNCNIYMLLESVFLVWQFKRWNLFKGTNWWIWVIVAVLVSTWIAENFIFFRITRYSSYFLIVYSFIISILSITIINRLIVTERKSLVRNPIFIISVAFVMFYTVSVLSEAFWIYGLSEDPGLSSKLQNISVLTNFIAIILYSVAILWMPSKQKFTLPSS